MPTPTKKRILEKARELFHRKESTHRQETVTNPEENELREGGYMEEAKTELMQGEPSQIAAQQDYLIQAGPEVGMKVMPMGEYKDKQLQVRRLRWQNRASELPEKKAPFAYGIRQKGGSILSKASKRWSEMRAEDALKSQERKARKTSEKSESLKITNDMKQLEKQYYHMGQVRGVKRQAYWKGYRDTMPKPSILTRFNTEGIAKGMGSIALNISDELTGFSQPQRRRTIKRRNGRHKKRSVRKKQSNDWLW